MAGDMRLPIGVTAALIAIAIIVLVVTDARDSNDTLVGKGAPEQPTSTIEGEPSPTPRESEEQPTSAPPPEAPTASPWLRLPEWVVGSPDILNEFYFSGSILDVATGEVWQVTAPGRAPQGQRSPIAADFLGWTPQSEALIGVSGGGRTALHVGKPGGDLRHWITVEGSDIRRIDVSWSPDGNLIAIGDLIVDAATGETVTDILSGSRIGWSADSRFFAVADLSEELPRVLAWDRETGSLEEAPLATTGVWSQTGRRLAYAPDRREATQERLNRIFVFDFGTGPHGIASILAQLRGYDATPVAWSPTGDHLVVEVSTRPIAEGGFPEHHIVNVETGETTAVIEGAWQPAWSPRDDTLVFIGNICTGFDIFTVQADGTALTNHTESDELDLWPLWSPDGEDILHVAYREDRVTLAITSIAEGAGRTVLSLRSDALSPLAWSPDSSYIAFRWGGGRGLCEGSLDRQETKVRLPE